MPNQSGHDYGNILDSLGLAIADIEETARQTAAQLADVTAHRNSQEMQRLATQWLSENIRTVAMKHILNELSSQANRDGKEPTK